MLSKNKSILALFLAVLLTACGGGGSDTSDTASSTNAPADGDIRRAIIGSAETPDPVEARIKALEAEGKLKVIRVMESFPLQTLIEAKQDVIDELEAMPRKALQQPKELTINESDDEVVGDDEEGTSKGE